jgi:signal transduction histidine kinase/ligand-binding sensor domain-containing protein
VAAAAVPPVTDLRDEYVVDSWQTENGLPDNFITSIAQTTDGYLWIGTFNGLTRFDGTEFTTFDARNTPELGAGRIVQLHSDEQGRLWIIEESSALVSWRKGRFTTALTEDGLPVKSETLRKDGANGIWIGTSDRATNYYHLSGEKFRVVSSPESFYERMGKVTDLQGRNWGIWSNCLCSVGASDSLKVPIPGFAGSGWRLVASGDGGLWVIADRVRKFKDDRWIDFGPESGDHEKFNDYLEDAAGFLWIGTDSGELWRVGGGRPMRRFSVPGATTPQIGRGMAADAEGNLWIGTGGSGLYRLKPKVFRNYGLRDGLASDLVRSVTEDKEGNIWIAAVDRIDWIPSGESEIRRGVTPVILPWEVFGANDKGIWVGCFGEGVFRVVGPEGPFTRYPTAHGFVAPVNAVFQQKNGIVDFGTPRGLMKFKDGELSRSDQPSGIQHMDVRSIKEDAEGRLWLGMQDRGLYSGDSNNWRHFTTKDGLNDDQVRTLFVDHDDNIWVGSHGGGLSRVKDGRVFGFPATPSGIPGIITSIIDDDLGYLWLASNRGLYRVSKNQLNEFAAGSRSALDVFHYDRADGMGGSQCTGDHQPAACKAQDGRLWFATMNGLTVVDPKHLPFNPRPPPVTVEGVFADGVSLLSNLPEGNILEIPAGTTRLEFHYAALTFVSPQKASFRYQLEAFDKGWVAAGNQRVAAYTKPPPGTYRFHVIAANNDNVWNNQGVFLDVHVRPLYWQAAWFRAAVIFAAAAAVVFVIQRRVQRFHEGRIMRETFSRRLIRSQEEERKRMSAELHDSLGQNLLVVNNYAAMALKEQGVSEKLRERLRKISESAMTCIEETRAIARSLRPYQLDRFGLSKTLEDLADVLPNAAGIDVTKQIDNIDGVFFPEVEINLYRVAQEWVNNVVKHSRATKARMSVTRETGCVRFILEDNGVGFDYSRAQAAIGQGSFGLMNLRERVRLLGGAVELQAAAGKGVRWTVSIPIENRPNSFDR